METSLKYDRVILTKELNDKFRKVGEVFEIANILNDSSFLLRDAKTKLALGVVSFEDFENHFVHEENFKGWTSWTPLIGACGETDAFYRTNRCKTEVRFITDNVRATSFTHKDDEFNLYFGIQLAYLRCLNKAETRRKSEYEEKLKVSNMRIIDNNKIMQKMINSLNK